MQQFHGKMGSNGTTAKLLHLCTDRKGLGKMVMPLPCSERLIKMEEFPLIKLILGVNPASWHRRNTACLIACPSVLCDVNVVFSSAE